MDSLTFWILVFFAAFTVYRLISRRVTTPKARVTAMLRQYHAFARTGLSEQESLLRLLAARRGWKNLPHRFLGEFDFEEWVYFMALHSARHTAQVIEIKSAPGFPEA